MKIVILDENLPRQLKHLLEPHFVTTVQQQGWAGLKNGNLLKLIEGNFDVFLTADKSLRYQQNLLGRKTIIIELPFLRLDYLEPLIPEVLDLLREAKVGSYIQVQA